MPTKIEWTDESWNPVSGCTRDCSYCYARRMAKRLAGRYGYPKDDPFHPTFHPDKLNEPLKWKKPRRIFVCSMGELFDPEIGERDIDAVFYAMLLHNPISSPNNPRHTFIILTKQPQRMKDYTANWSRESIGTEFDCYFPHVILGVSVTNQKDADERIPILLQTPAAVRGVSIEPMLEGIDIRDALDGYPIQTSAEAYVTHDMAMDAGDLSMVGSRYSSEEWEQTHPPLDWAIVGVETGRNRRHCDIEWIRSIVQQCKEAGVACFVKSVEINGEVVKDIDKFPPDLQVRQTPEVK